MIIMYKKPDDPLELLYSAVVSHSKAVLRGIFLYEVSKKVFNVDIPLLLIIKLWIWWGIQHQAADNILGSLSFR